MKQIETHASDNRLMLFLYWLVVGIPLLWGVSQTVIHALPLFV